MKKAIAIPTLVTWLIILAILVFVLLFILDATGVVSVFSLPKLIPTP